MDSKYTLTVDQAIKRGMIHLMWIPFLLIIAPVIIGIMLYLQFHGRVFLFIVPAFLAGFGISWWWWSAHVVRWKLWAYANVADIYRLEKKALRRKMIWKRGSWFEKTEIATETQRKELNELLERFNQPRIVEMIDDPRYFFEYTVGYGKIGLIISATLSLGAIYLVIDGEKFWMGLIGLGIFGWMFAALIKKSVRNKFFLKVDDTKIILEGTKEFPWSQVTEFYIERTGAGRNSKDFLIILGEDFSERINLDNTDRGANFIEHLLEVYHSRYLQKSRKTY